MDYWRECIEEAFEESKINATREQMDNVIAWVEGAYENMGLAMGYDAIPNPLEHELNAVKRKLTLERNKKVCPECVGKGRITTQGPYHSSNSECYTCRGEGKV